MIRAILGILGWFHSFSLKIKRWGMKSSIYPSTKYFHFFAIGKLLDFRFDKLQCFSYYRAVLRACWSKTLEWGYRIPKLPQTPQYQFWSCPRFTLAYVAKNLFKFFSERIFIWTTSELFPSNMRKFDPRLAPEFLNIAQPLKQLYKIRKMPQVNKLFGYHVRIHLQISPI